MFKKMTHLAMIWNSQINSCLDPGNDVDGSLSYFRPSLEFHGYLLATTGISEVSNREMDNEMYIHWQNAGCY